MLFVSVRVLDVTYAVVHGGDLGAGDLAELGQEVEDLQRGHEEHEVGQCEQSDHLPVRVLVHVLADEHCIVLRLAQVAQDLHSWEGGGGGGGDGS